jgi:soluble lytic murein transglycosylase-like protein
MRQLTHWTGSDVLPLILLICAPAALPKAAAQTLPADSKQRIETAASKQKAAVAAMASAIDRQTGSVRRQLGSHPTTSFFTLPPPQQLSPPMAFQTEACDALPSTEIDSLVTAASRREGVEPELIRGVMRQESGFRPCAVSPKGALGLMQLMPQTAAALEVGNPFDPRDNVTAGAKLLRQLLQHYDGDLALTLGAYNAGPSRVDADMAVPGIPETTNYVQRILSFLPMSLLPAAQMRGLTFDSDQP